MQRLLLAMLLLLCAPYAAMAQSADAVATGSQLTEMFYARKIDDIWERMDGPMRDALVSRDALAAFREQIATQLGDEKSLLDETVTPTGNLSVYRRRAHFEKFAGVIVVQWTLAADGRVTGFFIAPEQPPSPEAASNAHLDYQARTRLRLPFTDEAFVFWGGRSVEQNYHAANANQRFAYDFVMMRDGATHSGEGRRNDEYFCFGKPIVAPAAGEVVEVVDDVADNLPGQMNAAQTTGNRVVIDHGTGEFSLLAHFRQGSIRVERGERVDQGQRLGECGNSGNSSEPHLHYQLQDGPKFGDSAGLPAQFVEYFTDGHATERGEPEKGQHVRPKTQP